MLVVGLTGGIGSGKSAAAKLFAQLGADIIDTDELAREVVEPGSNAFAAIIARFGKACLMSDGSLNRRWLREQIFADKNAKIWLEKLLHPLIRAQLQQRIAHSPGPYCIAIIPLLFETGHTEQIDRVLAIDVDEELQYQRTCQRDAHTRNEVATIISSQISRAERVQRADDIIDNNGSLLQLQQQVQKLHQKYLHLAQAKTRT